jgi:CBS domain-containing protein
MLVSDIMTLQPNCCLAEATAQEAAGQMRQWAMGVLPVVEALETRKLVGIVTDRDLCMGVVASGRAPAHVTVRECMTREAICCAPGEPVVRALDTMRDHHVRRLPVVDSGGHIVGILSLTDIIRYAALPETEVVAAVAHICEPRGALGQRKSEVGATASD